MDNKEPTYIADDTKMLWPLVDADALLAPIVKLLAVRPDLAQKLLDLSSRDKIGAEIPALYHYLFEVAPRSACGAKHYLAAIRARSAEQIDLAIRARQQDQILGNTHNATSLRQPESKS